jgi:hypothetical protein
MWQSLAAAAAILVIASPVALSGDRAPVATADALGRLAIQPGDLERSDAPPVFIDQDLQVLVLVPHDPSRYHVALAAMQWLADPQNRQRVLAVVYDELLPEYLAAKHQRPFDVPAFPEFANRRLQEWLATPGSGSDPQTAAVDTIGVLADRMTARVVGTDLAAMVMGACAGQCSRYRYCAGSAGYSICGCRGECYDCCAVTRNTAPRIIHRDLPGQVF